MNQETIKKFTEYIKRVTEEMPDEIKEVAKEMNEIKEVMFTAIRCNFCGSIRTKYSGLNEFEQHKKRVSLYKLTCMDCEAHADVEEQWVSPD